MQRMARSSVLLYGVGGLGIEIGKSYIEGRCMNFRRRPFYVQ